MTEVSGNEDDVKQSDNGNEAQSDNGGGARRGRSRRMQKQFWIDAPFRERVRYLARKRGKTLSEVMDFAGVAVDYCYKPAEARNTNVIMAIAEALDVTPTELCGWPAPPSQPQPALKRELSEMPPEARRLQPLLVLFSEQTAALLRVLDPPKLPAPTAMLQLFYEQTEALLRAMTPDQQAPEGAEPAPETAPSEEPPADAA